MTPCEELGYKVGNWFRAIRSTKTLEAGSVVKMSKDDGTEAPYFKKACSDYEYVVNIDNIVKLDDSHITLRPGDYVSTKGMSEAEYHAVAEAFITAGAGRGEYPETLYAEDDMGDDWACGWLSEDDGFWHGIYRCFEGHQLTIAQVLGTAHKEEKPMTAFDTLIEAARKRNEAREALQEAEGVFQLALDAANAELGEGFEILERESQPHPVEDMSNPANWRKGDVVECISGDCSYITLGNAYLLKSSVDENGYVWIKNDDGDGAEYDARCFLFHHRPA